MTIASRIYHEVRFAEGSNFHEQVHCLGFIQL